MSPEQEYPWRSLGRDIYAWFVDINIWTLFNAMICFGVAIFFMFNNPRRWELSVDPDDIQALRPHPTDSSEKGGDIQEDKQEDRSEDALEI